MTNQPGSPKLDDTSRNHGPDPVGPGNNPLIPQLDDLLKTNSRVVGFSNDLEYEDADGRPSNRPAAIVFVGGVENLEPPGTPPIPPVIDGVPIIQRVIGTPQSLEIASTPIARGALNRPLQGGFSTGTTATPGGTGTLGYFVKDGGGVWYALSCAHVYGMVTAPTANQIYQPGLLNMGASLQSLIGSLYRAVYDDSCDAAIASLNAGVRGVPKIVGAPPPDGTRAAHKPMRVFKSGAVSDVTTSKVRHRSCHLRVDNPFVSPRTQHIFADLIGIHDPVAAVNDWFAKEGDSGSLVYTTDTGRTYAVGLVVAHSTQGDAELMAFASPFGRVLTALGVQLVAPGDTCP